MGFGRDSRCGVRNETFSFLKRDGWGADSHSFNLTVEKEGKDDEL